jgi:N-acetylneuraminic acid mutarotase
VGTTLTVVGDKTIYTFAGFDQYTDEVYNSLHQLTYSDTDACTWKRVIYTKGRPPAKRNDHSATLWNDTKLVIFGGSSEDDETYHNDIAILDSTTMTWEYPTTFGTRPRGRIRHSATIHNNKLYITGGIFSSNDNINNSNSNNNNSNNNNIDNSNDNDSNNTSNNNNNNATTTSGSRKSGQCQSAYSDSLVTLDLTTWIWQDPIPFVRRSQHITFVYHDRLYLFGGLQEDMTRSNYLSFINLSTPSPYPSAVTHIDIHSPMAPSLTSQRFLQICGDQLVVVVTPSISQLTSHSNTNDTNLLSNNNTPSTGGNPSNSTGVWTLSLESLEWQCRRLGSLGACHWHSFAMAEHGTHFYLFGTEEDMPDEYYSKMMCLDLTELGIVCEPPPQLGMDLVNLLQMDVIKPDFTLYSNVDHAAVPVHRLVLLARWPYFSTMAAEWKEHQADTLTLPYSTLALRGFVHYLYRDAIQNTDVCDLLAIAYDYSMARLLALCTRRLASAIHVNSVSKIYHAAKQTKQHGLQHQALQYLFDHFGAVSHSDGFRQLPRHLFLEILDEMPRDAAIVAHPSVVAGSHLLKHSYSNGSGARYAMDHDDDDDDEDEEIDTDEDDDDDDDAMET